MQAAMKHPSLDGVESAATTPEKLDGVYDKVMRLATGSAVVVFSSSECCMCHVAKSLLISLGVAPTVIDLGDVDNPDDVSAVLSHLSSSAGGQLMQQPLPAVFVGGRLVGGVESLMTCHINGSLVPLLKEAGALWL